MSKCKSKKKCSFKTRQKKIERKKRIRIKKTKYRTDIRSIDHFYNEPITQFAPTDCQLILNIEKVLEFIYLIRHSSSIGMVKGRKMVKISLFNVTKIDFATLNIIKSIAEELRQKAIILSVDLPEDPDCKKYLIDSGFLDKMFDKNGKKFNFKNSIDEIVFKKGYGKLTASQNENITQIIKTTMLHLTGTSKNYIPLKKTILEICANSIEHAYSKKGSWSLSVKYEKNIVLFTVTDLGNGILDTLYRKFSSQITDLFRSKDKILSSAFIKKYGSSTREINRNKGLPMIKSISEKGLLEDMILVTNDVYLPINSETEAKVFYNSKNKFRGTFYQWTVSNSSILNNNG